MSKQPPVRKISEGESGRDDRQTSWGVIHAPVKDVICLCGETFQSQARTVKYCPECRKGVDKLGGKERKEHMLKIAKAKKKKRKK